MTPTLSTIRATAAAAECELIVTALVSTGGNVTKAAKMLEMSRYALIRRMRKHEIMTGGAK